MYQRASTKLLQGAQTLSPRNEVRQHAVYYFCKRLLDLLIVVPGLVLLSPLIGFLSLLIVLDSKGGVFFTQKRVGTKRVVRDRVVTWQLVEFNCYKFRTMTQNADPALHQAYIKAFINHDQEQMTALQGENTQVRKLVNDPRITRMGKFLRKSSLDELPQIVNILRGQMSLVGPRPAIPYELEDYQSWHFQRLEATPGLTGLWQVTARCSVDFDEMVRLDIDYIERQSLWLDIKILLKTPYVVISCQGAH